MKNIITTVFTIGTLCCAGSVLATPVTFDVNGSSQSYVTVTNTISLGNLSATLSENLATMADFTLTDNVSKEFDFFTFVATPSWLGAGYGLFEVDANLSFAAPEIDASGSGSGAWGSVLIPFVGRISAGAFYWDDAVQQFSLSDGNVVEISLSQGFTLVKGSSQVVTATVTNLGGAAPVPEPSTMLLMGAGMIGLLGYNRKRFNKKA